MPQERKIYLNIQEQVEKNKNDILDIQQGATVLADFGIRVIGQVDDSSELPDPAEYEGEYGDAYAVGTEAPYDFYIFTRAFEGQDEPSWFNIGEFPVPGPQGEQGPAGQDGSNGKGIVSIAKTSTSGLEDTYTITYTDGTTSSYVVKNGANGQAAAIQSVTATVDSGTGTPSVEVSLGGTEQSRSFAFAFRNLRGAQGETGDPGSFIIAGQVTTASLLPDASTVEPKYIYLVGSASPYDVYAIVEAGDVRSWINLGPIAVTISDTKVGANAWNTSGTLALEVLNEIVNTPTMDFIRIGDRYFAKHSAGHYYALKRDSGVMLVYGMTIDLSTGEWTIATETMIDSDSNQTITGIKKFLNQVCFDNNGYYKIVQSGSTLELWVNNSRIVIFGSSSSAFSTTPRASGDNERDLGQTTVRWRDLYLSRNLTDGTNSITIADIVACLLPALPTANTQKQVPVIAPNGGTLSWEDKPTTLYKHTIRDGGPNYGWVIISTDSTPFDIASQASFSALKTYLNSKNIISFYDEKSFAPIRYNFISNVFETDEGSENYDDFVLSGATDTVTKL